MTIRVFYKEEMNAQVKSFSPSAGKPKLVVEAWLKFYGDQLELMNFPPAERMDFLGAHSRQYVDEVFLLRQSNGFGTKSREVNRSLRYTSGSMKAAALYALKHKSMTVSPTSGFHHAGWGKGGGFCTFNGLVIAAIAALKAGAAKVGIVDCDMHYGDGTDDILNRYGHLESRVLHYTAGSEFYRPDQADKFLNHTLPETMEFLSSCCDLILYQAGADPHIHDPLGGWLTTEQMRRRDRIVFDAVKRAGVPIAWNLAGGYQEDVRKVVGLHVQTMGEALAAIGEKAAIECQ